MSGASRMNYNDIPWGTNLRRERLEGPLEVGKSIPQRSLADTIANFRDLYSNIISKVPSLSKEYPTFDAIPMRGRYDSITSVTTKARALTSTGLLWDDSTVRLTLSTPSYHLNIDQPYHTDGPRIWYVPYTYYHCRTTFGVYTNITDPNRYWDYEDITITLDLYYKYLAGIMYIRGEGSLLSALDTVIDYSNQHAGKALLTHYVETVLLGWRDIVDEPRKLTQQAIKEQCDSCHYHSKVGSTRVCGMGAAIGPDCTYKVPRE